jgi:hypothetical protein
VITATSDKLSHTTTVTLAVQQAAQPNFTLNAGPAGQSTVQGDQATYTVTVNRTGGFSGPVTLSVSGMPRGAAATFTPSATVPGSSSTATLRVDTAGNTKEDTYALALSGSATLAGSTVARSAAMTLIVQKSQALTITGGLSGRLFPGRRAPLDLTVSNGNNFTIQITGLAVSIEEATSKPGCSGTDNFKVTQIPAARYPLALGAGKTKTLGQLGVADADKPQVEMLDRPMNQDACMNAALVFDYSGSAGK